MSNYWCIQTTLLSYFDMKTQKTLGKEQKACSSWFHNYNKKNADIFFSSHDTFLNTLSWAQKFNLRK